MGYCGADLKALCTEAALFALRRRYPQIYETTEKLVLDVTEITTSARDFREAMKAIVPTSQRSNAPAALKLSEDVWPVLLRQFDSLVSLVGFVFPVAWKMVARAQETLLRLSLAGLEDRRKGMERALAPLAVAGGERSTDTHQSSLGLGDTSACTAAALWPGGSSTRSVCASGANADAIATAHASSSHACWCTCSTCRSSLPNQMHGYLLPSDLREVYFDLSQVSVPVSAATADGSDGSKRLPEHSSAAARGVLSPDEPTPENSRLQTTAQSPQPQQQEEEPQQPFGVSSWSPRLTEAPSTKRGQSGSSSSSSGLSGLSSSTAPMLGRGRDPHAPPPLHKPRLLLCGQEGCGQSSHLAPALLHLLEELPLKTLDLPTVLGSSASTPEETCVQVCVSVCVCVPVCV